MEIKYEIREEDYINFNLYHIQNSPSQRRLLNLLRFILPFLCGPIMYFIGINIFKQPAIYWIIVAILFTVLWIIYYPRSHKKSIIKQTKKMLSEGDNSSFFGMKTLLINEDYIEILDESSYERISKDNIKSVKDYDDLIAIYLSSVSAHIIPTRYLNYESKKFLTDYLGL